MSTTQLQRSSIQLLLDRDFGTLFWGKIWSLIATWAFTIIIVTVAYGATGSTTWAGIISAAQMAPQLLFTLASGSLSDAYGERLPIVVGGALSGIGSLTLALWLSLTDTEGSDAILPLLVCALVCGSGLALSSPAMHSIIARLVRPGELSSAVSLNFLPTALARTIGPALGALLLAWWDAVLSLFVVGLVYALTTAGFFLMRSSRPVRGANEDVRVWSAVRYVVRDRVILAYLVAVAAIGFGAEPAITLAPAIADSVDHHGSAGLIVAAFGVGGLFGVLVHRVAQGRLAPRTEGFIAMVVLAAMIASASASEQMGVLLAVMIVAGCSMMVGITAFSVAVQQRCAPPLLGRVMAMWVLAFAGVRPLAAVTVGFVAEQWSLRISLLAGGCALVLTAAALALVVTQMQKRHVTAAVPE
ncbi:MFS transporter [Rhodococcus sp. 14C212]|uniref:MFS transporter n=1 Tax=Rhodococcus sp. 14C212 TaxID=2711209 RepID=UPI0013EC4E29|nr:MFS transporter [Rhodococcus sp. 14C212]